jgi:hypothetical protein
LARKQGDHIRVITLTSTPGSTVDIHRSFEKLKKRIRRRYGKFEYGAVKELTRSGLLHLHIVYRGRFMAQKWLSATWEEIHGAPVVWIARLFTWKLAKHLARYFIKEGVGRFWTSWNWVYRGFVQDWRRVVAEYGDRAVAYWHRWLRSWEPSKPLIQVKLGGG